MTQQLVDLVEQFCQYQLKQRGKTEGGVQSYRWVLEQFLMLIRSRQGRLARATDLTLSSIQMWMDDMADCDLALSTMALAPIDAVELLLLAREAGECFRQIPSRRWTGHRTEWNHRDKCRHRPSWMH